MIKKISLIICIFILFLTTLCGCYDARGVEELAYVTAIGLDLSDNDVLQLTLQISIPSSGSSSGSDSGSSQSSKTETITVDCNSINSGLALINSYISKEIDLSHCKVIIISKKLAENGLSPHIQTISNNIELRPNCNVIISKCDAKDYIENSTPLIESLTARYYEVAIKSSEYTGYIPATELIDFVGNISSNTIQTSAILGNLNEYSKKNQNNNDKQGSNKNEDSEQNQSSNQSEDSEQKQSQSSNKKSNKSEESGDSQSDEELTELKKTEHPKLNNNYVAGETPTITEEKTEAFGTAVFRDDKLIGELTGFETILHMIITNKLDNCTISVPGILGNNIITDLKINKQRNTQIKVTIIDNVPKITVNIFLEGYGLTLDKNINYDSEVQIDKIDSATEQYLKKEFENYLYKTSKEFNSDIDGFGKKAIMQYLTINDWTKSNWLENYKNSDFYVNVNVTIKGGYKFNQSP